MSIGKSIRIEYPDDKNLQELLSLGSKRANSLPAPWNTNGVTPSSVNCKRNEEEKCERGSVVIDEAQKHAIYIQQNLLQKDLPITKMQLGSTHNSHIDYADGYGNHQGDVTKLLQMISNEAFQISNQWITVTDQMNTGARVIELDVHYFGGDLRICHAGGIQIKYFNEIIEFLEKTLNVTIHFDQETIGCFSTESPTLKDAIHELKEWLIANPTEFLIIMLDDEMDIKEWGFLQLLLSEIREAEEFLFTPVDKKQKFPDRWPTGKELIASGKRLIINSRQDYGEEIYSMIFPRSSMWEEFGMKSFTPFPDCGPKSDQTIRITSSALWYAWFHQDTEWISPETLAQMMECDNLNYISAELITPELMKSLIWSFDTSLPIHSGCISIQNNKWTTVNCSIALPLACQHEDNPNDWILTHDVTPYHDKDPCPKGFHANLPISGTQNKHLLIQSEGKKIWLNGFVHFKDQTVSLTQDLF